MITVDEYLAQHAKEAAPGELTDEIRANAAELVERVNRLLEAAALHRGLRSGWRPRGFNAIFAHTDADGIVVRGGAPHSRHMTGEGMDVEDNDGALDTWCTDARLAEFELYREHPDATPSWTHFQTCAPHSGNRTFHP